MWLQAVRNLEIPVYDWDWAGFVGINPTLNMGMPQGYSRISQRI